MADLFFEYEAGKNFIKSTNVKVFPCAFRGHDADDSNRPFDVKSKLTTEDNLTSLAKAGTYIESFTDHKLVIYINGYRFEITDEDSDIESGEGLKNKLLSGIGYKLAILPKTLDLTANTAEGRKETQTVLGSFNSTTDGTADADLDGKFDAVYYFTGLVFATETAQFSQENVVIVNLLEKQNNANVVKSGAYLPNVSSNGNIGDFMTKLNDSYTGTAGSDILTNNILIKDEKFSELSDYKSCFNSNLDTKYFGARTNYSTVLGGNSVAGIIGTGAFATGTNNIAVNKNSVAFGENNAAAGVNSVVAGNSNFECGKDNFAIGSNNCINASGSFAGGFVNQVTGNYSTASGQFNEINGICSTVIGNNNKVLASNSLATGSGNTINAGANNSFTSGYNNTLSGNASAALGYGLTTNDNTEIALGCYNEGTKFFEIGYGTSDAKKNLFSVDKDGNTNVSNNLTAESANTSKALTVGTNLTVNGSTTLKDSLSIANKKIIFDGDSNYVNGKLTINNSDGASLGNNSITIGDYSQAFGKNSVVIGTGITPEYTTITLYGDPAIQAGIFNKWTNSSFKPTDASMIFYTTSSTAGEQLLNCAKAGTVVTTSLSGLIVPYFKPTTYDKGYSIGCTTEYYNNKLYYIVAVASVGNTVWGKFQPATLPTGTIYRGDFKFYNCPTDGGNDNYIAVGKNGLVIDENNSANNYFYGTASMAEVANKLPNQETTGGFLCIDSNFSDEKANA